MTGYNSALRLNAVISSMFNHSSVCIDLVIRYVMFFVVSSLSSELLEAELGSTTKHSKQGCIGSG